MANLIILLIFIIPFVNSHCNDNFNNECYDDLSAIVENNCEFNENDFNISEPIGKEGYINVTFALKLHCNVKLYEISLEINAEIKNEADCQRHVVATKMQTHTGIQYLRVSNNKSSIPVCANTATLTLYYVYEGCYKIRLQDIQSDGTRNHQVSGTPVIKVRYFKSTYNKTLIRVPQFTADYREAESNDHVMILQINSSLLKCITRVIIMFKCKSNCSISSRNERKYYIDCMLPNVERRTECIVDGNSSNISCFMKNETVGNIECDVKNITRGKYIFTIAISSGDIRCVSDTVWGERDTCEWRFIKEISKQEVSAMAHSPKQETDVYLYLSILAFILIALVVAAFISYKIRRKSNAQLSVLMPHKFDHGENRLIERPTMLLLYARDDEKLMTTMVAFREMLEQVCKSKVYDIYDPHFDEEIAADPEDWIREKLSHENCKTVLVLTKCGYLLSTQTTSSAYVYQHQQCYDTLFPYAMKILTQNLNCVSYTKLFIVNLNFDRNDYGSFEFFNPYTRYRVPDNVDKLLSDLMDKQVQHSEVQDETVYTHFLHEYNILQEYQLTHTNHIENVLRVQLTNS